MDASVSSGAVFMLREFDLSKEFDQLLTTDYSSLLFMLLFEAYAVYVALACSQSFTHCQQAKPYEPGIYS